MFESLIFPTVFVFFALQAGAIVLPGWFIAAVPALNMALTQLVIFTRAGDKLDATEKRNINRAVSIALFAALVLTGQVTPPAAMPGIPLLGAWIPWAIALLGWIWQGSQVIHDLLDFFKPSDTVPA